jgi:hypothetical protein
MTAFFALVRKDLILFLHDRRALLMSLALPIIIASFFGFLFGGGGEKGGQRDRGRAGAERYQQGRHRHRGRPREGHQPGGGAHGH